MSALLKPETPLQITTASRSRVWWLINMRGYQVKMELEEPRGRPLGGTKYVRRWVLDKRPLRPDRAVSAEGD